jgi:ankyrin repeat protein
MDDKRDLAECSAPRLLRALNRARSRDRDWLLGQSGCVAAASRDRAEVNEQDQDGFTLLHWASAWNAPTAVATLLAHGADPEPYNNEGWTPLCIASSCNHVDIIQALLRGGANVDQWTAETSVEHYEDWLSSRNRGERVDYFHSTPLLIASKCGNLEAATALLEAGADPYIANEGDELPLDVVCADSHDVIGAPVIAARLLEAMAWRRRSAVVAACAAGFCEER